MEENINLKNEIKAYIQKNLKISIDITGYNEHIIEINLILDDEIIDTDTVFVSRWTVGY